MNRTHHLLSRLRATLPTPQPHELVLLAIGAAIGVAWAIAKRM